MRIILSAFVCSAMLFCVSSAEQEKNPDIDDKINSYIAKFGIQANYEHISPNNHIGAITLEKIQEITKNKMMEHVFSDELKTCLGYSWVKEDIRAEIVIMHLLSQKVAYEWAFRLLILSGRAEGVYHFKTSKSFIGDFSITPKPFRGFSHGYDTTDSDKTFIIFVRDNTVVGVNSRVNFTPSIPVFEYAEKIDNILVNHVTQ